MTHDPKRKKSDAAWDLVWHGIQAMMMGVFLVFASFAVAWLYNPFAVVFEIMFLGYIGVAVFVFCLVFRALYLEGKTYK